MTKSLPNTTPHRQEDGNFGVGFFVGIMAGSVGMFLLGTKQGHQVLLDLKRTLRQYWPEAQETERKLLSAIAKKAEETIQKK